MVSVLEPVPATLDSVYLGVMTLGTNMQVVFVFIAVLLALIFGALIAQIFFGHLK